MTPSVQEMTGWLTRLTYTTPQDWAEERQPTDGQPGGRLCQRRCRLSQIELIGDLLDETNRALTVALRGEHPGRQRELGVDGHPPRVEGHVEGQQLRLDHQHRLDGVPLELGRQGELFPTTADRIQDQAPQLVVQRPFQRSLEPALTELPTVVPRALQGRRLDRRVDRTGRECLGYDAGLGRICRPDRLD